MIDLSPLFGSQDAKDGKACLFRVFPKLGRERWMLETSQRLPWYLKTWPRSNLRAKVIYRVAWALGKFGLNLPSRIERYYVAPGSLYAQLQERFEHLGIFLGTPGLNRKFVLYAGSEVHSFFIKVPLGPCSAALVARETAALASLATVPELACLVPRAQKIAGHLALENVEDKDAGYKALDMPELKRIHDLLFRRSACMCTLSSLRQRWQAEIPSGDVFKHSHETKVILATARLVANRVLDSMPRELEIPCYMAHGDFTRWNVLRGGDGKARIIDWELYGLKPKWFDIVHYIVSYELLVSRASVNQVVVRLTGVGGSIGASAEGNNWWRQVALYFAYQCLYYSAMYEQQVDLHQQALWQLEAWAKILMQIFRSSEVFDEVLAVKL